MAKTATSPPPSYSTSLVSLQSALQAGGDKVFEEMSAELFSRLLDDIAVTVSKTGSQFGADAGTAGLRGRRLRIECKRYRNTTRLDPRGLAGEVMEAVAKDPLLETWVLMATKKVTETERNLANAAGEKLGVPIIVIDWTMPAAGTGICSLAALCATWPDVVERHMGKAAADAARLLTAHVGSSVNNVRKDLQFWNIGFRTLRANSIKHLERIWESSAEARAVLNQDAAGGRSGVQLISRAEPLRQLKDWWLTPTLIKAPVVVSGLEGVGKTWVTLDWANKNSSDLPIIVILPASAFLNGYFLSEAGLRELLMRSLRAAANSTLTDEYWRARVNNLVQRPSTEGAAILLIVDGLNQQPHITWSTLAATVQGDALAGKVRLAVTVRRTYFETDLRRLGELTSKPVQVTVGPFDDIELDELLKRHGMNRTDMHPALTRLASVPRLFPLIYKLKDNVALQSEASIPRLLFEYGRDVLQQRQQSTLTEDNWVGWLVERAKQYHQKIQHTKQLAHPVSYQNVAESLDSPHLSREEVARRLSDVVDGGLFQRTADGVTTKLVLQQDAAILGLGLALLDILATLQAGSFDAIQAELEKWLEPVAAIDQVTEVLRAALAVSSAMQGNVAQTITDNLLVTWMNAQNPTASFQRDVKVFGDAFPCSMLAVVERSSRHSQEGALFFAIQSLRNLPTHRTLDWQIITERMAEWTSWILLPRPELVADPTHYAKGQLEQLVKRIGKVSPGTKMVLNAPLKLDYQHLGNAASAIPSILEGHDLANFALILQRAAIHEALQVAGHSQCWSGLAWLTLVGGADEEKTRACLQTAANAVLKLEPEPGIHLRLRNRVAALLLRLTGDEALEIHASTIDEFFGSGWDYTNDYLNNPGDSFFALERRHVEEVLANVALPADRRLDKWTPFLAAPDITLPTELLTTVEATLKNETFKGIDESGQFTAEEHRLERLEPVAARFLQGTHVDTARRRLQVLASRNGELKYWSSLRAPQLLLTAKKEESDAFAGLRTRTRLDSYERLANTWCLQLELLHSSLEEQLRALLAAKDYYYTTDLMAVIRNASSTQLLEFVGTNTQSAIKAARVVLEVLAFQLIDGADTLAEKLVEYLTHEDEELMTIAFVALASCSPEVCGRKLLAINWKPDITKPICAHYGSWSIAVASRHFSFHDVLPMVAPWRWLDAAVARGNAPAELRLASNTLLALLKRPTTDLPKLTANVSMRVPDSGELARLSISERPAPSADNFEKSLRRAAQSNDEVNQRIQELAKEAAASIQNIRSSGYSLYLHAFTKENVRHAYLADRKGWNDMLEGADTLDADFLAQVHSAEGLYVSLCDTLLEVDPPKGAVLWRALSSSLRVHLKGKAGIPELVHMIFRAPDSPEVSLLRDEFSSLTNTNTDKSLLDLVIAAQINGKDTWLDELVKSDTTSSHLWRRKRAIMIEAFRKYPSIDTLFWPEGEKAGSWRVLKERMVLWTNKGVFARYWWDQFITASTADEAFCAWTVFLSCADRRAHIWMESMAKTARTGTELDRLRHLHVQLNLDLLERRLTKPEESSPKLADKLFGQDTPVQWLQLDQVKF